MYTLNECDLKEFADKTFSIQSWNFLDIVAGWTTSDERS